MPARCDHPSVGSSSVTVNLIVSDEGLPMVKRDSPLQGDFIRRHRSTISFAEAQLDSRKVTEKFRGTTSTRDEQSVSRTSAGDVE